MRFLMMMVLASFLALASPIHADTSKDGAEAPSGDSTEQPPAEPAPTDEDEKSE